MKITILVCFVAMSMMFMKDSAAEDETPAKTSVESRFRLDLYNIFLKEGDDESLLVHTLLKGSQVETPKKAEQVAQQAIGPGMDAMASLKVVDLFRTNSHLGDFARPDQLIWRVRLLIAFRGVSGEIWVNAKTGKAVDIFSLFEKPK